MPGASIAHWTRPAQPRARLVCLPWAGGGAGPFREWRNLVPPDTELLAVRWPGRESRLDDPPHADLAAAVSGLADDLHALPDLPTVLFGHCSGGLLAFELARELRRRGGELPGRLVVASCEAPGRLTDPRPIGDLRTELAGNGVTDPRILGDPDLLAVLAPPVLADLALSRSYVYESEPPLPVPVTVVATEEDLVATPARWMDWQRETTRPLRLAGVRARQLFPNGAWSELAGLVSEELPCPRR
ncbi:alpha/beta fold hydrolase [Amycolatopsis sp. DG1A-15b]|uniref:thioesterase II family protein n=1 Tax=Amycolatopsis sp. DG1A-15b TaxID=3052846 RepID=UPI00255BCD64|nr:alpha/beta fold hydrolase [Amycolatopsis sp. DG1A-15b]WIX92228.1 alpha/beta fold hydrolase [Amycolatopsis sp. DG1A-15b]